MPWLSASCTHTKRYRGACGSGLSGPGRRRGARAWLHPVALMRHPSPSQRPSRWPAGSGKCPRRASGAKQVQVSAGVQGTGCPKPVLCVAALRCAVLTSRPSREGHLSRSKDPLATAGSARHPSAARACMRTDGGTARAVGCAYPRLQHGWAARLRCGSGRRQAAGHAVGMHKEGCPLPF